MKKKRNVARWILAILGAFIVLCICLALSGCNEMVFDTERDFRHAQIKMPDGTVIEGNVSSWGQYGRNNNIKIVIDGVAYMTNSENCVLYGD